MFMKKIYFSLVFMVLATLCIYGQDKFDLVPYSGNTGVSKDWSLPDLKVQKLTTGEIIPDSTITYNMDGTYRSKTVTMYPGEYYGCQIYDVRNYYWSMETNLWIASGRLVNASDEKGRILQEVYEWSIALNDWVINPLPGMNYKVEREYNAQNLIELDVAYMWNVDLERWIGSYKSTMRYDTLSRLVKQESFYWDYSNNDWLLNNTSYPMYEETEDGKPKTTETLIIYSSGQEDRFKTEFEYDTLGNCSQAVYSSLTDTVWNNTRRNIYAYDSNNNRILSQNQLYSDTSGWVNADRELREFNADNQITYSESQEWISTEGWMSTMKTEQKYNAFGVPSLYTSYVWNTELNKWEGGWSSGNLFDNAGKPLGYIEYLWDLEKDMWVNFNKSLLALDSNGNIMMSKMYVWDGQEWILDCYAVYYPFNEAENQEIEAEETKPIGEDNKGKFEIALTLPTEATVTGSFYVEFPEGINLDEENTALSPELTEQFDLIFTSLGGNKWKIEIVAKQQRLRSALSEVAYKKILDVAYIVDDNAGAGEQTIEVTDVSLEKSTGGTIEQESLTVTVEVRNTVGVEDASSDNVVVYVSGEELIIRSSANEVVTICSVNGAAVAIFTKQQNEERINISALPAGVYVVKSNTGWVAKVAKR